MFMFHLNFYKDEEDHPQPTKSPRRGKRERERERVVSEKIILGLKKVCSQLDAVPKSESSRYVSSHIVLSLD